MYVCLCVLEKVTSGLFLIDKFLENPGYGFNTISLFIFFFIGWGVLKISIVKFLELERVLGPRKLKLKVQQVVDRLELNPDFLTSSLVLLDIPMGAKSFVEFFRKSSGPIRHDIHDFRSTYLGVSVGKNPGLNLSSNSHVCSFILCTCLGLLWLPLSSWDGIQWAKRQVTGRPCVLSAMMWLGREGVRLSSGTRGSIQLQQRS